MIVIGSEYYHSPYRLSGEFALYGVIIVFIIQVIVRILKHKATIRREFSLLLFYLYLGLLFSVTLFPINLFSPTASIYKLGFGKQQLSNFNMLTIFTYSRLQIIGNLVLLIPFSFFIAVLWRRLSDFRWNLSMSFLFSLAIEIMQLIMSYFYLGNRSCDINDLFLNTCGALLGYVLYKVVSKYYSNEINSVRYY